jgi:hypothetical protein
MLDYDDLADLHEDMPGITPVKLFPMGENSVIGSPITVGASERRPMDASSRNAAGIDIEAESIKFHLWVNTFSTLRTATIRRKWIIEEADGTRWSVVTARLEMMRTRWACDCVRNYDDSEE